jgi:hypothetical protein
MPLIARNVNRTVKELLRTGALPGIRFHDLRLACATLLLIARVDPKVVSDTDSASVVVVWQLAMVLEFSALAASITTTEAKLT